MCFLPHFVMCAHRQTGTHTHTQPHTLPLCKHLFSHSTSLPDHNFYYQRRALQLPLLLLNFVGASFRQAGAAALPAPALPARLPASHRETLKLNWPRKKHLDVNKHVCLLRQGEKKKKITSLMTFAVAGLFFVYSARRRQLQVKQEEQHEYLPSDSQGCLQCLDRYFPLVLAATRLQSATEQYGETPRALRRSTYVSQQ